MANLKRPISAGLALLLLTALVLVACGDSTTIPATVPPVAATTAAQTTTLVIPSVAATTTAASTAQTVGGRLYVRDGYGATGNQLVALKIPGGTVERQLPFGTPNNEWTTLYTAVAGANRTTIAALDLKSGKTLRSTTLEARFELPEIDANTRLGGLSLNGQTLVVAEILTDQQKQKFKDEKRWVSRFAILDTALQNPARTVELSGNFAYDVLSPDGQKLYLIEHLLPYEEGRYVVRLYDLTQNKLLPGAVVDKGSSPTETEMEGYGLSQLTNLKGDWVFTVYRNAQHGPFVHALNTTAGIAVCLDLPKAGKENEKAAALWGLAMNSNATRLYAVNSLLGQIVEFNISDFPTQIRLKTDLTVQGVVQAKPQRPAGVATLSPDGATLYALDGAGLVMIDTVNLKERGRLATRWTFDSIAASLDGTKLYATSTDQPKILVLDAATGAKIAELTGPTRPWGLLRIEK